MAGAGELPSGVVTFLLTDIEGSTRLWQHHPEQMDDAIARHDELIRTAVSSRRGVMLKEKGEGDSTFSVFTGARDATAAAVEIQRSLQDERWPDGIEITARIGLHTGEANLRDGDYFGTAVNRCARIRTTAHGGQIVCSQTTAELIADDLPVQVSLRDLGSHGLRDLSRPERIHQIDHPSLRSEFPPLRTLGTARSNLPAQRTSFVGREEQVDVVREHLAMDRLVTLTGVGGCGKTRLAIEVATRELDRFDGGFFCDLSAVSDPDVVAAELATAVGLPTGGPLVPSVQDVREELLAHLADRKVLLVIDNCEHLLDAIASLVDDLLDRCAGVRLLATSREALEVDGERTYTVPSLDLPQDEHDIRCASVELFCERAGAASPGFRLTQDDSPMVVEICRRLDGIPLAIELAAGQLPALTVGQLADRLSDRFRLLSGGRRRVQRQQTLAAMLDWSHDLLSPAEQRMLRLLSVFPQPFTLEQAESLAGDGSEPVAGLIRALVAKSLVAVSGDRLRLLETVRLYAEQRLLEAGDAQEARRRHRDMVLHWAEAVPPELALTPRAAVHVTSEVEHIREALRWSEAEGRWDLIARIATRTAYAFSRDLSESADWLAKGTLAQDLPPREQLTLYAMQAWIGMGMTDFATLVIAAETAIALDVGEEDEGGVMRATAHGLLALAHGMAHYLAGSDESARLARQHIEASRQVAETGEAQSFSSTWIGVALCGLHELDAARDAFAAAVAADRVADAGTGAQCTMLALTEILRNDVDAAVAAMERAHEILVADRWASTTGFDAFWLAPYAGALELVGRSADATDHVRALVEHLRITGSPSGFQAATLASLGVLAQLRGAREAAAQLLVRAVDRPLSPLDHQICERYLAEARAELGDERTERAMDRGRQLPFDDALQLALDVVGG